MHEGDKLVTEVVGPAFDGYVYADLYEPDGNVVHLLPNAKEKTNQFRARSRTVLGEDVLFGRQWDIVPPFGKHLLVVMASRTPLFDRARPEVEDVFGYLRTLRDHSAKGADERFVAYYTLVDFLPRR